jgi:hypothetical protein
MDDEANAIDNLTEEEGNADSNKSASSTILLFCWASVTSLIALAAKKVAPPIASKKVRIPSKPYDRIFIKFIIRRSITFKNGIKFRKSLPRGRQGCR